MSGDRIASGTGREGKGEDALAGGLGGGVSALSSLQRFSRVWTPGSSLEDADSVVLGAALTDETASAQSERSPPRQGSKLSIVIDLLARRRGAGLEELASVVGWLPHTTRAALTGLRKRGYAIERERSEKGGSVYRIVTGTTPALAA